MASIGCVSGFSYSARPALILAALLAVELAGCPGRPPKKTALSGSQGEGLPPAINAKTDQVAKLLAESHQQIPPQETAARLVRIVSDPFADDVVRVDAARCVAQLGKPAVRIVMQAINAPGPDRKYRGDLLMRALGVMGSDAEEAAPLLATIVRYTDDHILDTSSAASALVRIVDDDTVLSWLYTDIPESLRIEMQDYVSNNERFLPKLLKLVADGSRPAAELIHSFKSHAKTIEPQLAKAYALAQSDDERKAIAIAQSSLSSSESRQPLSSIPATIPVAIPQSPQAVFALWRTARFETRKRLVEHLVHLDQEHLVSLYPLLDSDDDDQFIGLRDLLSDVITQRVEKGIVSKAAFTTLLQRLNSSTPNVKWRLWSLLGRCRALPEMTASYVMKELSRIDTDPDLHKFDAKQRRREGLAMLCVIRQLTPQALSYLCNAATDPHTDTYEYHHRGHLFKALGQQERLSAGEVNQIVAFVLNTTAPVEHFSYSLLFDAAPVARDIVAKWVHLVKADDAARVFKEEVHYLKSHNSEGQSMHSRGLAAINTLKSIQDRDAVLVFFEGEFQRRPNFRLAFTLLHLGYKNRKAVLTEMLQIVGDEQSANDNRTHAAEIALNLAPRNKAVISTLAEIASQGSRNPMAYEALELIIRNGVISSDVEEVLLEFAMPPRFGSKHDYPIYQLAWLGLAQSTVDPARVTSLLKREVMRESGGIWNPVDGDSIVEQRSRIIDIATSLGADGIGVLVAALLVDDYFQRDGKYCAYYNKNTLEIVDVETVRAAGGTEEDKKRREFVIEYSIDRIVAIGPHGVANLAAEFEKLKSYHFKDYMHEIRVKAAILYACRRIGPASFPVVEIAKKDRSEIIRRAAERIILVRNESRNP